jgi:hypothetical protein
MNFNNLAIRTCEVARLTFVPYTTCGVALTGEYLRCP